MTTVADEGNRRKGDMSIDEMEQCIQGNLLKTFFNNHQATLFTILTQSFFTHRHKVVVYEVKVSENRHRKQCRPPNAGKNDRCRTSQNSEIAAIGDEWIFVVYGQKGDEYAKNTRGRLKP